MMKFLIIVFVLVLSGCGMQGDLYLPDENADSVSKEANQPAK